MVDNNEISSSQFKSYSFYDHGRHLLFFTEKSVVLNLPIPPSLLTRFPPPPDLFSEALSVDDEPPADEKKPAERVDHDHNSFKREG